MKLISFWAWVDTHRKACPHSLFVNIFTVYTYSRGRGQAAAADILLIILFYHFHKQKPLSIKNPLFIHHPFHHHPSSSSLVHQNPFTHFIIFED